MNPTAFVPLALLSSCAACVNAAAAVDLPRSPEGGARVDGEILGPREVAAAVDAASAMTFTLDVGQVRQHPDQARPAPLWVPPYGLLLLPIDLTTRQRTITETGPATLSVVATHGFKCSSAGPLSLEPRELIKDAAAQFPFGRGGRVLSVELELRYRDDVSPPLDRPSGHFCYGFHLTGGGWLSSPTAQALLIDNAARRGVARFTIGEHVDLVEILFDNSVHVASITILAQPYE
jgi:hypothetical protein